MITRLRRIPTAWIVVALAAVLLYALAPALLSPFRLALLGKYLCYAIVAVGIGLAWGRGGMLVLGQGVFFGLGGYVMAMHLKLADAGPGRAPDFMYLYGSGTVPTWWEPFRDPVVTVLAILLLPAAHAAPALKAGVFEPPRAAPDFALSSSAGGDLSLARYRGKVVLLSFGFTHCAAHFFAAEVA